MVETQEKKTNKTLPGSEVEPRIEDMALDRITMSKETLWSALEGCCLNLPKLPWFIKN